MVDVDRAGALDQQRLGGFEVSVGQGAVERRPQPVVYGVGVGAHAEQLSHLIAAAVGASNVEARLPMLVIVVDVGIVEGR